MMPAVTFTACAFICSVMSAGPVLNLSFLMDEVMEEVKPLYWDAVLDSPIPLKVPLLALLLHVLVSSLSMCRTNS